MEHSNFNVVDISVLSILLLSGALAFMRGVTRELFSLGAWAGASAASVAFYPLAKPWVHTHIKNEMATDAATAIGLFCLALIILIPIGNLFASMIKGRTLTAIDRSLGFVFGLLRGALVVSLLFLCMSWLMPTQDKPPEWLAEAKTRPLLAYGAEFLRSFIPMDQQEKAASLLKQQEINSTQAVENAKMLQQMSTPVPVTTAKDTATPAYGTESRTMLDQLINQKAKP